jgi:hypothetical protein
MDINKPKMDIHKSMSMNKLRIDVNKPEAGINKPAVNIGKLKKDHSLYFVLAFILCIVVFVFLGWRWVRKDNDTKTVEDNLKAELLKNPVKTTLPSASNQTASNQAAAQSAASSQMAQNSSASELPESTTATTEPQNSIDNKTTPESSSTKKFESTKLKVSFDYPEEISVSESDKLITITKPGISWKIKFYDNNNKKEFQSWYESHFDIKTIANCTFTDATIKVGSYDSKLVKPASDSVKCDGDGNYATSTDKSKVVKIEAGKETTENVNKILTSFKFTE